MSAVLGSILGHSHQVCFSGSILVSASNVIVQHTLRSDKIQNPNCFIKVASISNLTKPTLRFNFDYKVTKIEPSEVFFPMRHRTAWNRPTQRCLRWFDFGLLVIKFKFQHGIRRSEVEAIFIDQPQCLKSLTTGKVMYDYNLYAIAFYDNFFKMA